MTLAPLTKRQREVLTYVETFIRDHGYAPALDEIGSDLGLSSLATVSKHLQNLQEKGYVTHQENRPRSIALVPVVKPTCPHCGGAL